MVSPQTPKIVKRYGPSGERNLVGSSHNTVVLKKRFEPANGRGVGGEAFDYLRASKNGNGNGNENNGRNNWGDEHEGGVTEDMFLQRALAAIEEAGARGDGMVEMGEREWQAWSRHEAMELEIEKRVAEREREREMQRERDLARAEELQRELDMLRQSTITRSGTFGSSGGEPGFLVDQRLSPFGAGYASNSSSSSSLPAKITRPYATFTASHRSMPSSTDHNPAQNLRPALPRDQQRENQTHSSTSYPSSPALSTQPANVSTTSRTAYPSIPTSKSAGALTGKSGKEGKTEKGKKGSDGEEDVYSSAAAALKDVRRRKRL